MYVIVGLGNPGRPYEHTRHNAGFDALDILSEKTGIRIDRIRCKSLVGEGRIGGEQVVLAKPQTFMNESGQAVVQLMNWYKPGADHLIVLYDDIDLPIGRLRVRPSGSAGTHNGMRSIIYLLGRDDFPRVRIGVGKPPHPEFELKDFVLSHYTKEEQKPMFDALVRAGEAVQLLLEKGVQEAQAVYNRKSE